MADATTFRKTFFCNPRQRITDTNMKELSSLSNEMDSETTWDLHCAHNCVVSGYNVTQTTALGFAISGGISVINGEVTKDTLGGLFALDAETTGNPRIDRIELTSSIADFQAALDYASITALTAITRTVVAIEAVGTGDAIQKEWDLGNDEIDITTLRILLDGVEVGGWDYQKAHTLRVVDYIIFHASPGSGVAITATYTHLTGGIEVANSLPTRSTRTPAWAVVKGTPGATPAAPPITSGYVQIALITVPANWSGDAVPSAPTIDNTIKAYAFFPDENNDPSVLGDPYKTGRSSSLISGMCQITSGLRPVYSTTDTFKVTPGFLSHNGWSGRNIAEASLTLQTGSVLLPGYINGSGWWYVYGSLDESSLPGRPFTLHVSATAPNSLNQKQGASSQFYAYIGAIYVSTITPITIQPFYTHGEWVYWEAPTGITSAASADKDISQWCPETGRLLEVSMSTRGGRSGSGDLVFGSINSHLTATGLTEPSVTAHIEPVTAAVTYSHNSGPVRAEDVSGTRAVHMIVSTTGSPASVQVSFVVAGYLDDYRTMSTIGVPTFY